MNKQNILVLLFLIFLGSSAFMMLSQTKSKPSMEVNKIISSNINETCIGNNCVQTISSGPRFDMDPDTLTYKNITDILDFRLIDGMINISYKNKYYILFEPYIIYNGNYYNISQALTLLKRNYPDADFKIHKFNNFGYWKYALNFSNVPEIILNKTQIGLKRIGSGGLFLDDIKIEGNMIVIKDKVILLFDDLIQNNFSVNMNLTDIIIGNLHSGWLDPVVTIKANDTSTKSYSIAYAGGCPTTLSGTELGSADYLAVGSSDNSYANVRNSGSSGYCGGFRFNYTIPTYTSLNWVYVSWEGYKSACSGFVPDLNVVIWNFTSSAFVIKNSTCPTSDVVVNYNITTNGELTSFVNSNKIHVDVYGKDLNSNYIYTDYSYIQISYIYDITAPTYLLNSTNSTFAGTPVQLSLNWTEPTTSLSNYSLFWNNGANWTWNNQTVDKETGTIQKITSSAINTKAGNFTATGNPTDRVTFSAAMPSTSYSVLLSGETDSDTMYSVMYSNKLVGSFNTTVEDDGGTTEAGNLEWMTLLYGDTTFGSSVIKCGANTTAVAAGDNTITFPTAFPDSNYVVVANSIDDDDSAAINLDRDTKLAATVGLRIEDDAANAEATPEFNYCAFTLGEYSISGVSIKAGNKTTVGTGDGTTTVAFATPFSNANYQVIAMMAHYSNGDVCAAEIGSKNTTHFVIHFENNLGADCTTRNFEWVAIPTGENILGFTEANTTSTTYADTYANGLLAVITNITVTVNVSSYSNSGSNGVNSAPDLWLQIYNGSQFLDIGNFSVVAIGNFSLSTQIASILSAWKTAANTDITIKGIYMDTINSTHFDEINYTAVWVTVASTGIFVNDTWQNFNGGTWSNVTKTVNSTAGTTIQWGFCANDTVGNMNCSETFSFTTTLLDNTPPTYSNIGVNNTNPSILDQVMFYSQWSDNNILDKFIFGWNATGVSCDTWGNDTAAAFLTGNWTNTTKQIPATCLGKIATIGYIFYANDTSNNWNSTTPSNPFGIDASFNISMPSAYTWTTISGTAEGSATALAFISFNFTNVPQISVQPYANGESSKAQNGVLVPIFYIDNVGTTDINISLKLSSAPATGITVKANASCTGTSTFCQGTLQTLTTDYIVLVNGTSQTSSFVNITMYADVASGTAPTTNSGIDIYIKGED